MSKMVRRDDGLGFDRVEDDDPRPNVTLGEFTPEQEEAAWKWLENQERTFAETLADQRGEAESRFMNLAHAEQRLAADRGEQITLAEGINRASRRWPEIYDMYRRTVTQ